MRNSLLLLFLISTGSTLPAAEKISLAQAWDIALRDSPTREAAQQRVEQATARWQQARAANQPGIRLEAGATRLAHSDSAIALQPGLEDTTDQYLAAVKASWLLLDGGTRKQQILAGRYGTEVGLASLEQIQQQLLGSVSRAYFAAQLARESMRIAEADAAFNARQLEDARLRHEAGLGTHADTLNFEIRMNSASTTVALARSEWTASTSALAALLAWKQEEAPEPGTLEETLLPAAPREVPAVDLSERPDLRTLRAAIAQAAASARAIRGEYLPDLRLTGAVDAQRQDDPNFATSDVGESVGLSLTVDLWDGSSRKNRIAEAKAKVLEAEAQYQQALLDAQADVQSALASLKASQDRQRLSERNLLLAKENRDLIEKAYRAGSETLLRLNEAQKDLTNAESQAALARIQANNAEIDLRLATGTLQVPEQPARD